ncbi:hypothetical protein H310_13443 [Aphanomyces invadans]|uniref:PPM-type phosphatase domain-containing protein n=1 Tax=Aphanomyces invadans TaxID=157072 RepID=A0A024TDH6_9STRA|nr:hypothetical protein H310_13443 [Aphanomyces invadans]ETV92210.1 hypothetical protein H310_13443 [Aphanomyces invadans]|eukprot:XP_008879174.1 hypothetical protein H310_13443 [Aphanomyces invadans]
MTSMVASDDACILDNSTNQDVSNDFGITPSSCTRLHVFARKPRQLVKPPPSAIRLLSWSKTKAKDDSQFFQNQAVPRGVSQFSSSLAPKPKQPALKKKVHVNSKLGSRVTYDAALAAFTRDKASMCQTHVIDPLSIQVGIACTQGTRAYMEDRHVVNQLFENVALVAVFDGHNGAWAAEFASTRLSALLTTNDQLKSYGSERPIPPDAIESIYTILKTAFLQLDREILSYTVEHGRRDGATVALVLVFSDFVFAANVGDSRVVLVRRQHPSLHTNAATYVVERLSIDHKPHVAAEKARIVNAGGNVVFSGCWRVTHPKSTLRLAVSRSLGDHQLKNVPSSSPLNTPLALVSAVPHIRHFARSGGDILVIASDGLWDRVTDGDTMHQIVADLDESFQHDLNPPPEHFVTQSAAALVELALTRRTADNVTVAVVAL